jgi:hypothetical protein
MQDTAPRGCSTADFMDLPATGETALCSNWLKAPTSEDRPEAAAIGHEVRSLGSLPTTATTDECQMDVRGQPLSLGDEDREFKRPRLNIHGLETMNTHRVAATTFPRCQIDTMQDTAETYNGTSTGRESHGQASSGISGFDSTVPSSIMDYIRPRPRQASKLLAVDHRAVASPLGRVKSFNVTNASWSSPAETCPPPSPREVHTPAERHPSSQPETTVQQSAIPRAIRPPTLLDHPSQAGLTGSYTGAVQEQEEDTCPVNPDPFEVLFQRLQPLLDHREAAKTALQHVEGNVHSGVERV